jgi:hypothetical protein
MELWFMDFDKLSSLPLPMLALLAVILMAWIAIKLIELKIPSLSNTRKAQDTYQTLADAAARMANASEKFAPMGDDITKVLSMAMEGAEKLAELRELVDQMVSDIKEIETSVPMIRKLIDQHAQTDDHGVPRWYVTQDMKNDIKAILEDMKEHTKNFQDFVTKRS